MSGRTSSNDAYRRIRQWIIDGDFQAGHRLVEADLVAALDCGRFHIREALARLNHEGMVESKPGCSSVVRHVPTAELIEVLDARITLETMVARAAAENRTALQAADLAKRTEALEASAKAGDLRRVLDHEAGLHHAVVEASCHSALPRIIESLAALTAQTRMQTMHLPRRVVESVQEHRAISDAVIAGDSASAGAAMAAHLANVRIAVVAVRGLRRSPAKGPARRSGRGRVTRRPEGAQLGLIQHSI